MAVLATEERRVARPASTSRTEPSAPRPVLLTRAETAECTCPEACERDHELD